METSQELTKDGRVEVVETIIPLDQCDQMQTANLVESSPRTVQYFRKKQFKSSSRRHSAHSKLHYLKARNYSNLKSRLLFKPKKERFRCGLCGYKTHSRTTLVIHKRIHASTDSYICNICDLAFQHRAILKRHSKLHKVVKKEPETEIVQEQHFSESPVPGFKAEISRKAEDVEVLEKRESRKLKAHLCLICDYSFPHSSALRRHQPGHENIRKFKCSFCDFWSDFKTAIFSHVKFCHQKINPASPGNTGREGRNFPCNHCPYKATIKQNLDRHVKSIHSTKKQQLLLGPRKQNTERVQEPVTSVDMPRRSTRQGLTSNSLDSRTNPYRVVPNIKVEPTKSPVASAKAEDDLRKPSKTFRCASCPYQTVFRTALTKHERSFHQESGSPAATELKGERKFPCSECSYRATHRSHLKRHMTKIHGVIKQEPDVSASDPVVESRHRTTAVGRKEPKGSSLEASSFDSVNPSPSSPQSPAQSLAFGSMEATQKPAITIRDLLIQQKIGTNAGQWYISAPSGSGRVSNSCKPVLKAKTKSSSKRNNVCKICKQCFDNSEQLRRHETHHESIKAFKCSFCPFWADYRSAVSIHEKLRHSTGDAPANVIEREKAQTFDCSYCPYKSNKLCNLTRHLMRGHSEKRKFKCIQCSYSSDNSGAVRTHEKNYHGEGTAATLFDVKEENVSSARNEDVDIKGEGNEEDNTKGLLDVKPLKMDFTEFPSSSTTYKQEPGHVDIKLEAALVKTNACSPTTDAQWTVVVAEPSKQSLRPKPYKCEICSHAFYDLSRLKRHQTGHETIRAFKCSVCPFWSDFDSAVCAHERYCHGKERLPQDKKIRLEQVFQCSICDYKTNYSSMLDRHMKGHSVTNGFKCSLCPFWNSPKINITIHEKNCHNLVDL